MKDEIHISDRYKEVKHSFEDFIYNKKDINRVVRKGYEHGRVVSKSPTHTELKGESEEITTLKQQLRKLEGEIQTLNKKIEHNKKKTGILHKIFNRKKVREVKKNILKDCDELESKLKEYKKNERSLIKIITQDEVIRGKFATGIKELNRILTECESEEHVPVVTWTTKGGVQRSVFQHVPSTKMKKRETEQAIQMMQAFMTSAAQAGVQVVKDEKTGREVSLLELSEKLEKIAEQYELSISRDESFDENIRSSFSTLVDDMIQNNRLDKLNAITQGIGKQIEKATGLRKKALERDLKIAMDFKNKSDVEVGVEMLEVIAAELVKIVEKYEIPENTSFYAVAMNMQNTLKAQKKALESGDPDEINKAKGALVSNVDNLAPAIRDFIGKAVPVLKQRGYEEEAQTLENLRKKVRENVEVSLWDRNKDVAGVKANIISIFKDLNTVLDEKKEDVNPRLLSPVKVRKKRKSAGVQRQRQDLLLNLEKAEAALAEFAPKMEDISEKRNGILKDMQANSAKMKEAQNSGNTKLEEELVAKGKELASQLDAVNKDPENKKVIEEFNRLKVDVEKMKKLEVEILKQKQKDLKEEFFQVGLKLKTKVRKISEIQKNAVSSEEITKLESEVRELAARSNALEKQLKEIPGKMRKLTEEKPPKPKASQMPPRSASETTFKEKRAAQMPPRSESETGISSHRKATAEKPEPVAKNAAAMAASLLDDLDEEVGNVTTNEELLKEFNDNLEKFKNLEKGSSEKAAIIDRNKEIVSTLRDRGFKLPNERGASTDSGSPAA